MNFYIPVKLYEESNCVRNHAADIASLGRSALIVTGRHSAKACGALGDVIDVLESNHQSYTLFDEVEENPSRETVMKGRDLGLTIKADFVIGIGGGSPMDACKAIALMMAQPEEGMDYLYSKQTSFHVLPILTIPTTCGTGSEATAVSVLTNHQTHTKKGIPFKLFPNLSLIDEKYLRSLSHRKICDTAVDALAHLMESYLNSSATDFSRMFVKEGLEVWGRNKAVLSGEKETTPEDLRRLLYASTMGGMAIAHTGTSIPHVMSYAATCDEGISHGRACGYYLMGFLRESGDTGRYTLPQMCGFTDVDQLESFVFDILEMDINEISEPLRRQTAEMMTTNTAKLATSLVPMTPDKLLRIARVRQ